MPKRDYSDLLRNANVNPLELEEGKETRIYIRHSKNARVYVREGKVRAFKQTDLTRREPEAIVLEVLRTGVLGEKLNLRDVEKPYEVEYQLRCVCGVERISLSLPKCTPKIVDITGILIEKERQDRKARFAEIAHQADHLF